MGFLHFASANWFDLLQSLGIITGVLFTAVSFRVDSRTREISNLLTITEHHRDILKEMFDRPELARVTDPKADLQDTPVTAAERLFVRLLILHLSGSFRAQRDGLMAPPDGLKTEIRWFFSLPVPKVVWGSIKEFQDKDFVEFVEENLGQA